MAYTGRCIAIAEREVGFDYSSSAVYSLGGERREVVCRKARRRAAIDFFMQFVNADCEHVAVENPVSIMSTQYRKPDQIIQPWMFGHPEKKATCLWLKGLPPLVPTNDVSDYMKTLPKNQQERLHYLPPSPDRAKLRSKTFPGVARAMAEQWGGFESTNEHDVGRSDCRIGRE